MSSRSERHNQRVRDCKESFKRMRMKILQSERLDRAREQMRQKARELKKRGQAVASAAAENPRLQRLKRAMQRKMDEEEAAKNTAAGVRVFREKVSSPRAAGERLKSCV